MLVLLGLFLLFLLLLAVTVEHDGEDDKRDSRANDYPEPAGGLKFVQSGFRLLVAFLIKETSESEAIDRTTISKDTCLKVGATTNDVARVTGRVGLLED